MLAETLRRNLLESLTKEIKRLNTVSRTGMEVMNRGLLSNGSLTREQAEERLMGMIRCSRQQDWLIESLSDLLTADDEEPVGHLVSVNWMVGILIEELNRQEILRNKVELREEVALVAQVSNAYFYGICANLLASLYSFTSRHGKIVVTIGADRTLSLFAEDFSLPEAVMDIINAENPLAAARERFASNVYGMVMVRLFCEAVGWEFSARTVEGTTVFRMNVSEARVLLENQNVFSSERMERRRNAVIAAHRIEMAMEAIL